MMKGRYDFGGGAPEPKYSLKMPEVKHIKAETLREIIGALPEDMARRVINLWIGADGTISIDLEARQEEREGEKDAVH